MSTEAISNRVQSFKTIMGAINVDPKALQLILQGSVRLQVNEGPLEIASTFLAPNKISKYPADKVEKLREKFREFLKACDAALTMNSRFACLFVCFGWLLLFLFLTQTCHFDIVW